MDKLGAMEAFVRVAEAGSFSAVARELGSTQSAVSKQVAALEANLGVKLLTRSTRATALTDEGQRYLEAAQRVVNDVRDAEMGLRQGNQAIQGRLRVGASVGFGRRMLFPALRGFMAAHPALELDVQLSDSFVDVVAQGLDVALRVGDLSDSSLLAQRIGTTHRSVVASRALAAQLSQQGKVPQQPSDLANHNCIVYTGLVTPFTWVFDAADGKPSQRVRVNGRVHTNSSEVVCEAILAGMGIGFTPNWFFTQELANGEVIRLLAQYSPHPLPIHAIYPASRRHSAKVAAFVAWMKAALHSPVHPPSTHMESPRG